MIRAVLERNRRLREYSKIRNRCIRYSFQPKLIHNHINIDDDGISIMSNEKNLKGNSYIEVYYNKTYILIKREGHSYCIYPKILPMEYLTMLIHDLIVTGSDITLLLENNEDNFAIKDLIDNINPNIGIYIKLDTLYYVSYNVKTFIPPYTVSYNVNIPMRTYTYTNSIDYIHNHTIENILSIPSVGRVFKIMSKYVAYI